jgi:hypothetical protein
MSHQSKIVTFQFTCPEARGWLVVKGDKQKPRVVEMRQRTPGVWSEQVELIPDEYQCRYYSGDERNVIYFGPAHIEGGVDRGMDTMVSVKVSDEKCDPRCV